MNIQIISGAFCLGIYLSEEIGFVNMLFVCIGMLPIAILGLIIHKTQFIIVFVAVCMMAVGAASYKYAMLDEFYKSSSYLNNHITATGRICDIPYKSGDVMKYVVDIRHISDNNHETVLHEKFVVYSKDTYKYGDTITFRGTLDAIPHKMNSGDFETEKYYKQRGISAKISADSIEYSSEKITDKSLTAFANSIRNSIDRIINKYYTEDRAVVVKAVLTGDKGGFSQEMQQMLTRTGTTGIFYPAYIHMMLLSTIISYTALYTHKKYRDMAVVLIFIIFALINSGHPSFVRVCVFTAMLYLSGIMLKRKRYIDVFAATLLVCSIANPLILFQFGFISSAICALSIKGFYKYTIKRLKINNSNRMLQTLVLHGICFVGTLPITAYYFGYITIYSAVISIIILPVIIGMIIDAPLFLAMVGLFGKAPIVGQFMTSMTSIIMLIPKLTDKLPFSGIYIKSWSAVAVVAYLCILFGLVYVIKKKKRIAYNFICVGLLLSAIAMTESISKLNKIEVDFVNVGQGDGALIRTMPGANILIDGGGSPTYSDYDTGVNVYLPYLLRRGVKTVEAAFVSHYHKDHVQGIVAALDNIKVKNIFMPCGMRDSEWCKILEEKAMAHKTKVYYIGRNTSVCFNNGLRIDVNVPGSSIISNDAENDTSLMMNVSYGDFNCLFTGDMSQAGEKYFMENKDVPQADVLKIAHHGSSTSTGELFFNIVSPKYSIISLAENNQYHFPSEKTLDTIKSSEVFRTDLNGDISIISDKKSNIRVETLR